MINIKTMLGQITEEVLLINAPIEYKNSEIISELLQLETLEKLIISNESYITDQIKICNPKKAIQAMYNQTFNLIVIIDVYLFDLEIGHQIEYILQFRPKNTKIIYFAHMYDFFHISKWLKGSKVINHKSTVNFHIIGYEPSKNDFAFEMKLNYKINPFINRQTLIYCSTHKNCKIAAEHILKDFCKISEPRILQLEFDDEELKNCVMFGIAYISNELSIDDKSKVKNLYMAKKIEILVLCDYLEGLVAETIIIKSTKKYTETEYQERKIHKIIELCQPANSGANIYIMTTKAMSKFNKNIFNAKVGIDYDPVAHKKDTKNDSTPYFNFSAMEHHLHEFLIYLIYFSNDFNFSKSIKRSFLYFMIRPKNKELDLNLLITELIDFLSKSRIIISTNTEKFNLENDLIKIFLKENISLDSFIKLIKIEGNEEDILSQISELPEVKRELQSKIKYKKNELLIDKVMNDFELKKSLFNAKIICYIKICVEVKTIIRQNLGAIVMVDSIMKSKFLTTRKLDYCDIKDESFTSESLKIDIKCDSCSIKTNNDKKYICILEKSSILLYENRFYNSHECKLEHNVIIYCICRDDFGSSAILKYQNGCLNIVHRYYKNTLKDYKNRTNKRKTTNDNLKVIKHNAELSGTKIEFTAPQNITLPEWFSK